MGTFDWILHIISKIPLFSWVDPYYYDENEGLDYLLRKKFYEKSAVLRMPPRARKGSSGEKENIRIRNEVGQVRAEFKDNFKKTVRRDIRNKGRNLTAKEIRALARSIAATLGNISKSAQYVEAIDTARFLLAQKFSIHLNIIKIKRPQDNDWKGHLTNARRDLIKVLQDVLQILQEAPYGNSFATADIQQAYQVIDLLTKYLRAKEIDVGDLKEEIKFYNIYFKGMKRELEKYAPRLTA